MFESIRITRAEVEKVLFDRGYKIGYGCIGHDVLSPKLSVIYYREMNVIHCQFSGIILQKFKLCNEGLQNGESDIKLYDANKAYVLGLIRRAADYVSFKSPTILNTFIGCLFEEYSNSSEKSKALMKALPDFADEFKSIFEHEIELLYTDNLPAAKINLFDCFCDKNNDIYYVESFYGDDYVIKTFGRSQIGFNGKIVEVRELMNNEQFRPVAVEEQLLPLFVPVLYNVISLLYFTFESSFASNFGIQLPTVPSCIEQQQNMDVYMEKDSSGLYENRYYLKSNGACLRMYFMMDIVSIGFDDVAFDTTSIGKLDFATAQQMIRSDISHDESMYCYNIVKKIYEEFCPIVYRLGLIPWLNEVMNCWQSVVCGQPIASHMIENHNPSDVPHYEGSAVKRISTF